VLNVWAKQGEIAVVSPEAPLALFGDISSLRVRTEVEERDVVKIRVGQRAVIKADAFAGQEFTGVVTSMAPALGPQRITSRGPRRPNDVEVLEVMVTLDGQPPLLTGMRVDVFFKADDAS
jgi:HlyD family secretion protein